MNKAKGKYAKGTQKVRDIPGAMRREEARRVRSPMIDEAHRTRKCDTCRAKGKEGVEITPSKDDADLCRECRQSKTGQNKESCCGECGAYEKGMQGEKCKYC